MMSSCSAGLVRRGDCCWSSHLMDKEGKLFERIWWKRHDVKLLCRPRPARWLLLVQSSDGQGRQVIFERIWWKRHDVKLLCRPRPARWLLLVQSSDGQGRQVIWENLMEKAWCQVALPASSGALIVAGPVIWWTRKASNLRESDGKGMMSSCSAGLVRRADCCWSSHLMDKEGKKFERIWWKRHDVKLLSWPRPARWLLLVQSSDGQGRQVIWENLMEKAWCQVALLASSSVLVGAPAIWGTGTMKYTS